MYQFTTNVLYCLPLSNNFQLYSTHEHVPWLKILMLNCLLSQNFPQSLKHSLCGILSKDVTPMVTRRVWHGRPGSHHLSTYISQARSCLGIRDFEPSVRPFVRPKVCQSNFFEPRLIFNAIILSILLGIQDTICRGAYYLEIPTHFFLRISALFKFRIMHTILSFELESRPLNS